MSLSTLPSELLDGICSLVGQKSDLCNVSRVNRVLNVVAERVLYRIAKVTNQHQASVFRESVKSTFRADWVRELTLDAWDSDIHVGGVCPAKVFETQWLSLFPNLESLSIFVPMQQENAIVEEMKSVSSGLALTEMKSLTLGFKPSYSATGTEYGALHLFNELIFHPLLADLCLLRMAGTLTEDCPAFQEGISGLKFLKSFSLLSCNMNTAWLRAFFMVSKALEHLSIAITSRDEEMMPMLDIFRSGSTIAEPLWDSVYGITYINLLPVSIHSVPLEFSKFTHLRDLTITASDLFGSMSKDRIDFTVGRLHLMLPRTIERLNLVVHSLDILNDTGGLKEGIYHLLFRMLSHENKHRIPVLRLVIIRVATRNFRIPAILVERASEASVICRAGTTEEAQAMMSKLHLQKLVS